MFDRLRAVMQNKNRIKRELLIKRREEVFEMKQDSIFRAKLQSDLDLLSMILMNEKIESIDVETSNKYIPKLDSAMYGADMAEFNTIKNGNVYNIRNREIDI